MVLGMGFRQNQNWYLSRGSTQKKFTLSGNGRPFCHRRVILSNVEFYDDDEYLDPDRIGLDFKRQIVKFKYFDGSLVGSLGLETLPPTSADEFRPIASDATEYSKQRRKKRRGQQFFRSRLMEAYGGKCAVTGESHERV